MLFPDSLPKRNLLPYHGEVNYYGKIFEEETANQYFNLLFEKAAWQNDEVKIFGKTHITKRKMAWYSAVNQSYSYSNTTKVGKIFFEELITIKQKIELITNEKFNACLLNLYHNGTEGMGWHSDDEKEIEPNSAIASISFGAERYFNFKHKTSKETLKFNLENGSLFVMKGETQKNWLHSLTKALKITAPRINLTFRKMIN